MVSEGFWWLVLLSPSSNKSMISVWSSLISMVCEKQFSVLCHNKSMLYKSCTKRMLLEPSIHRSHWKSFTSPKSVYAVSARTLGLAPTWHRFTQTHLCSFVSLRGPPTEQLAPQYHLTPRPSQFPQIWHMMGSVGQHMDAVFPVSQVFTLPTVYRSRSSSRNFLTYIITDLRQYRLTSSLNHSVYWLPHVHIASHFFIFFSLQFCHSYHQ